MTALYSSQGVRQVRRFLWIFPMDSTRGGEEWGAKEVNPYTRCTQAIAERNTTSGNNPLEKTILLTPDCWLVTISLGWRVQGTGIHQAAGKPEEGHHQGETSALPMTYFEYSYKTRSHMKLAMKEMHLSCKPVLDRSFLQGFPKYVSSTFNKSYCMLIKCPWSKENIFVKD